MQLQCQSLSQRGSIASEASEDRTNDPKFGPGECTIPRLSNALLCEGKNINLILDGLLS